MCGPSPRPALRVWRKWESDSVGPHKVRGETLIALSNESCGRRGPARIPATSEHRLRIGERTQDSDTWRGGFVLPASQLARE